MTNEAEVYFALFGRALDPDEVTRIVGIEPALVVRRADARRRGSIWKVSSGKIQNDYVDVYDMSAALVTRLTPFSDGITLAKRQFDAEAVLKVVLWISTNDSVSTPAIGFDSEVLSFLVAVGATLDIDTYRNVP